MRKPKITASKPGGVQINNSLLNAITPFGGLEFLRNKFYIGENAAKIYAVTKYPQSIEAGWLAKISNIPQAVTCQIFESCDNSALIEHLSRSITQYRSIAESARDALERQRAEKAADDAENLMRQIDQNGETVGYMSNLIMPVARDGAAPQRGAFSARSASGAEALEKICRSVESVGAALHCKARLLTRLQKEAYQAISPYHVMPEDIRKITRRNVPLSTFMGGMPFASSGYSDRTGYYVAKDTQNGLIVLDPWARGGDRTNSNFLILGVAGVGKSTAAKSILMSEFMSGTRIIVCDAEREYRDLCLNLGGDWINCGGGSGGMINPLEIRPVPLDDEDEDGEKLYSNGMGAMALHFKSFEIFIKLYMPDLTEIQKALLKQALEELYGDFGIAWDTDVTRLKPADFPIFSDLYALLKSKLAEAEDKSNLEHLCVIIRELAEGSDSFLWNGHTTVNPKSRFICLDTFDLQNTSDSIKKTQYYNMLQWAWERMSRNRAEKALLVCDEAYLLVDPNVPQSLIFLRNVAKRARKYEAGLMIISHSVVDFLDPAVKLYGQALMDIPTYKLIMGTDGKNLAETAELYGLTEVEQEHLFSKKRGHGLFMIGSKRLFARFDVPQKKLARMGKGGGR
jgi:type IV secretory pathway VirB4 component